MNVAATVLIITLGPGFVLLLMAFAIIDRLGGAANRRWRLPWRRDKDGRPMAASGLDELDAFYGPGKRYEIDQRQATSLMRDEQGDGAPPRVQVDLKAGTAKIRHD